MVEGQHSQKVILQICWLGYPTAKEINPNLNYTTC